MLFEEALNLERLDTKPYIGGVWDSTAAAWTAFQDSPSYKEIVELLSKAKDKDDLIQASWYIGFALGHGPTAEAAISALYDQMGDEEINALGTNSASNRKGANYCFASSIV